MERTKERSAVGTTRGSQDAGKRRSDWTKAFLVFFALSTCASARIAAQVTEYPIPTTGGYPAGIVAGPDGALWFTERLSNRIGRITTSGVVTEFPIPSEGANPLGIAAGRDGNLWFVELATQRIGRITPAGVITEFGSARITSLGDITAGPDNNVWATGYYSDAIYRISGEGAVTQFPVGNDPWPSGIAEGPDGNLWFTEAAGSRIGRITTTGVVTEFPIPSPTGATDIAAGSDGALWFTEQVGKIGRVTTAGAIVEFSIPSGATASAITAAPDGSLWFTEPAGLGRITTAGAISEFHLPSKVSPTDIAAGPDGNLWITDPLGSRILRIVPAELQAAPTQPGACVADARTLCLNEGRFEIRADWQVRAQGTNGHATAIALTPDTGAFWFFDSSNFELVAKVLDACTFDGHTWFFAAGLTDVAVTITVRDSVTGMSQVYLNPAGEAFQPIQDTSAFSTCPSGTAARRGEGS